MEANFYENASQFLAKDGMYITDTSVYIVSNNESDKNVSIIKKNGKNLYTYKPVYLFSTGSNNYFLYDYGSIRSSAIQKYVERISKNMLFSGMHAIALVLMNKGYNLDTYKNYIAQLLDGHIKDLPEVVNSFYIPQCDTYRVYNRSQYSNMSLYLEAAKEM